MYLAHQNSLLFLVGVFFISIINGQGLKRISSTESSSVSVSYGKEIIIEAENYYAQNKTENRKWYLTSKTSKPKVRKDNDEPHLTGASNGKYLELLPDTMYTNKKGKSNKVEGKNYAGDPGKMAKLTYIVNFDTAGKYYLWLRGYANGTSDNSVHVGLNDEWPDSGKQLYICDQNWEKWAWSSYQITNSETCNTKNRIFIEVEKPGKNQVMFSMREDGLEFDKFLLTKNPNFKPN